MGIETADETTTVYVTLPCELADQISEQYGATATSASEAVKLAAADGVLRKTERSGCEG